MSECKWRLWEFGSEEYLTSCNNVFEFTEGDAQENGFIYCPFCSRPINDSGDNI